MSPSEGKVIILGITILSMSVKEETIKPENKTKYIASKMLSSPA